MGGGEPALGDDRDVLVRLIRASAALSPSRGSERHLSAATPWTSLIGNRSSSTPGGCETPRILFLSDRRVGALVLTERAHPVSEKRSPLAARSVDVNTLFSVCRHVGGKAPTNKGAQRPDGASQCASGSWRPLERARCSPPYGAHASPLLASPAAAISADNLKWNSLQVCSLQDKLVAAHRYVPGVHMDGPYNNDLMPPGPASNCLAQTGYAAAGFLEGA